MSSKSGSWTWIGKDHRRHLKRCCKRCLVPSRTFPNDDRLRKVIVQVHIESKTNNECFVHRVWWVLIWTCFVRALLKSRSKLGSARSPVDSRSAELWLALRRRKWFIRSVNCRINLWINTTTINATSVDVDELKFRQRTWPVALSDAVSYLHPIGLWLDPWRYYYLLCKHSYLRGVLNLPLSL